MVGFGVNVVVVEIGVLVTAGGGWIERVGSAASSASWKSLSSSSLEMLVWWLGFTSMLAFARDSERNALKRPLPTAVGVDVVERVFKAVELHESHDDR